MFNKDNLKNIYNYDNTLIDKLNQMFAEYKWRETRNNYIGTSFLTLIKTINSSFNDLKDNYKDFIYHLHLTNKIYTENSLDKIKHFNNALVLASKDKDYSKLLEFVKNDKNLSNTFERIRHSYDIFEKNELEQELEYDLKADAFDSNTEYLLKKVRKSNSDWLMVVNKQDAKLVELKNEEMVLEKLFDKEFKKFKKAFFNNLEQVDITIDNDLEIDDEMEY